MKTIRGTQATRCRWQVQSDAYGAREMIYAVKDDHYPLLIGRCKYAAHIVRLHNASLTTETKGPPTT